MNNLLKLPKNIRKKKINVPKKIALYLLNDDFTSMDFVVKILIMKYVKKNLLHHLRDSLAKENSTELWNR